MTSHKPTQFTSNSDLITYIINQATTFSTTKYITCNNIRIIGSCVTWLIHRKNDHPPDNIDLVADCNVFQQFIKKLKDDTIDVTMINGTTIYDILRNDLAINQTNINNRANHCVNHLGNVRFDERKWFACNNCNGTENINLYRSSYRVSCADYSIIINWIDVTTFEQRYLRYHVAPLPIMTGEAIQCVDTHSNITNDAMNAYFKNNKLIWSIPDHSKGINNSCHHHTILKLFCKALVKISKGHSFDSGMLLPNNVHYNRDIIISCLTSSTVLTSDPCTIICDYLDAKTPSCIINNNDNSIFGSYCSFTTCCNTPVCLFCSVTLSIDDSKCNKCKGG